MKLRHKPFTLCAANELISESGARILRDTGKEITARTLDGKCFTVRDDAGLQILLAHQAPLFAAYAALEEAK